MFPSVHVWQSTQLVQSIPLTPIVQLTTIHALEAISESKYDAQQSMLMIFAPDTHLKMEDTLDTSTEGLAGPCEYHGPSDG